MSPQVPFTIAGLILGGISYAVYCVIFYLYLRLQFKRVDRWKSPVVYAAIGNFILCTAYFAFDTVHRLFDVKHLVTGNSLPWFSPRAEKSLSPIVDTLYTCIDFISQGILIYRCWIMWRRPLIMVVPIILSLAFLGTALPALVLVIRSPGFGQGMVEVPDWYNSVVVSFFSISLAVNTLVTGLIIFKILIVYRDLQEFKYRAVYIYGNGPRDLYPMVSILVESGMITFVAQLLQSILYKVNDSAFRLISGLVVMVYGISTIIVLVRVQMGLSYDSETVSSRTLRFAPVESNIQAIGITRSNPNPGPELKIVGDVYH